MAKSKSQAEREESRPSRRQVLRQRKQAAQRRKVQLAAGAVVGLLVLIALIAVVVEFFIVPGQTVASVKGEEITIADWQAQVEYQRARFINSIEEQYELFVGEGAGNEEAELQALRFIQQTSGQQIGLLASAQGAEVLGELVLDQMVDNIILRAGAEERGITVTQEDVDAAVGERFNYYGGGLPTPEPTHTATPMPTPSITPIPTQTPEGFEGEAVADEAEEEEEPPATPTPPPTATPVSEESFNASLQEELDAIRSAGADPDLFFQEIENSIYRERMAEVIFEEQGGSTEGEHVSVLAIEFEDEEVANQFVDQIAASDFLEVWNRVRSIPGELEIEHNARTREVTGRIRDDFEQIFNPDAVDVIFDMEVGEVSDVLTNQDMASGETSYLIVQVTGREVRPLNEFTLTRLRQEVLGTWLEEQRTLNVEVYENWRNRIPRQPILDQRFLQPVPTPSPFPTPPPVDIQPTVPESESE